MVSGGIQPVPLRRTLLPAIRDRRFLPTVSISAQQDGNALTARSLVSGGVLPYSYQWSSSTGSLTPTNTPGVSYLVSAGKESPVLETLTLNVTDANGVTASASQTFTMDVKVPAFALQGALQSGGLYSAGTEWVGMSMGLGGSAANANGFLVRFVIDNLFHGGSTVRQAWMQTGIEVQGASERVAVMGVIGPSGSSNWNDHYWGKGTTGPDILDVRGWWLVSSPCD